MYTKEQVIEFATLVATTLHRGSPTLLVNEKINRFTKELMEKYFKDYEKTLKELKNEKL